MKREDFLKFFKRQIQSKPVKARERVACGLDHPEVREIIRRHEQAVAERKRSRSQRRRWETFENKGRKVSA